MLCGCCQSYCEYSLQFSNLPEKYASGVIFLHKHSKRVKLWKMRTNLVGSIESWFYWNKNISTFIRYTVFDCFYYITWKKRCQQYPVCQFIFRKYSTKFRSGKGKLFMQNRNKKHYNFLMILIFMNKLKISE